MTGWPCTILQIWLIGVVIDSAALVFIIATDQY